MNTNIPNLSGAIHFVGIGGIGMSGIAEVLINLGCSVQGSDITSSTTTQRLSRLGAMIYIGHQAENIKGADVVVVSSAVEKSNPEIVAAQDQRIPVIKRAEMLAELMRFRYGIAIAGTHGKTTTTSLVAMLLSDAGLDPTYVIGGKVEHIGGSAALGKSNYLVVEADESDASFLHLQPILVAVTNIDADHLGSYQNDFEQLKDSFASFIDSIPFYATAVICNEDAALRELQKRVPRQFLKYGFSEDCDIYAYDIHHVGIESSFCVRTVWSDNLMKVHFRLPGKHNVLNALAAIGIAHLLDIDDDKICHSLHAFGGINRRFQTFGEITVDCGQIQIVDDYGHHPTEIQACYEAACMAWPKRRKILIFQPHRYTRTKHLFEQFADTLSTVDQLILLDIYSAGEEAIEGISSAALCEAIRIRKQLEPIHVSSPEDVIKMLASILKDGDVVITMGAGSIHSLAHNLIEELQCSHAA